MAIKPGTPVSEVEKYINMADMVLIMTVEPGFGGQKFMENQMEKVKYLRDHYPLLDIEVDGGVGPSTIHSCANVSNPFGFIFMGYNSLLSSSKCSLYPANTQVSVKCSNLVIFNRTLIILV